MKRIFIAAIIFVYLFNTIQIYASENDFTSLKYYGIIQGDENGMRYEEPLSRAELATLIIRITDKTDYLELVAQNIYLNRFIDVYDNVWYKEFIVLTDYMAENVLFALNIPLRNKGTISQINYTEFYPEYSVTVEEFLRSLLYLQAYHTYDYNGYDSKDIIEATLKTNIIKEQNKDVYIQNLSCGISRQNAFELLENFLDLSFNSIDVTGNIYETTWRKIYFPNQLGRQEPLTCCP